jgi:hypothetical protein
VSENAYTKWQGDMLGWNRDPVPSSGVYKNNAQVKYQCWSVGFRIVALRFIFQTGEKYRMLKQMGNALKMRSLQ